MEPITIVAVVSSISALIVSILSHIKRSKCFGIDIETRDAKTPLLSKATTPVNSEHQTFKNIY